MKQFEILTDLMVLETSLVLRNKSNPKHLLAGAAAMDALARVNIGASMHMRYQKKTPKVRFFDTDIVEVTSEQKVHLAAKTLAKHRNKK